MKNQVLFSSKDKSKTLKCCLLQFLFDALRVKYCFKFPLCCGGVKFRRSFSVLAHFVIL